MKLMLGRRGGGYGSCAQTATVTCHRIVHKTEDFARVAAADDVAVEVDEEGELAGVDVDAVVLTDQVAVFEDPDLEVLAGVDLDRVT